MNGIVQLQGVTINTERQVTSRGRIAEEGLSLHRQDDVTIGSAEPFQQTLVVVNADPVKVGRELGDVPAAHQEAGGLPDYLRDVPEHRFYGPNGQPDYNGILADLARKSWATLPDSLEDGRLPNLSTFQRAVARERQSRDEDLGTQLYLAIPGSSLQGAVIAELERSTERDLRSYSGVQSGPTSNDTTVAIDSNGNFASQTTETSSATPYTVTAQVVDNPESAIAQLFPTAQDQAGSLANFLRQVPNQFFYNDNGNPNYNKIFADLARFNGCSGPEDLENGRLPNITTFQRAVSKERAGREQETAAALAGLLFADGWTGAQANRVLALASRALEGAQQ